MNKLNLEMTNLRALYRSGTITPTRVVEQIFFRAFQRAFTGDSQSLNVPSASAGMALATWKIAIRLGGSPQRGADGSALAAGGSTDAEALNG